ncbi:MAG: MFS transporter, partial [Rhodospirillales bacterium]|nr:MFS transporter [Rhodospirillales bacterium]
FHAHFWMPIFFLYFLRHMELADVLRLEAIYYAGVVLLEVPSGYFSDRFGRRLTLLIANATLFAAYLTFFFGASFTAFAVAQVMLATGLAFNSGTDTSLHFDSLASLGREKAFDDREAAISRNSILASGLAGLAGGVVGVVDLRLAYALSALAALVGLVLVLAMREPRTHEKILVSIGPAEQLKTCGKLLTQPILAWVFAFYIVMTVLNHVPYEFYQPYIELALSDRLPLGDGTTLATGVHVAVVMVVAAWFAARSIRLRDRLGLGGVLLSATALQTVIILAMGLVLHPLIILLALARSVPRALMTAPINAAVAPRVGQAQRATFLSVQSLAGRLAFSGWLLTLSIVPTSTVDGGWAGMSNKLLLSGVLGFLALLGLAISWHVVQALEDRFRKAEVNEDRDASQGVETRRHLSD